MEIRNDNIRSMVCCDRLSLAPASGPSSHTQPPAKGHYRPDNLDKSERPRPLKKPVNRSKRAKERKCEDEPGAPFFQRVADKTCRN